MMFGKRRTLWAIMCAKKTYRCMEKCSKWKNLYLIDIEYNQERIQCTLKTIRIVSIHSVLQPHWWDIPQFQLRTDGPNLAQRPTAFFLNLSTIWVCSLHFASFISHIILHGLLGPKLLLVAKSFAVNLFLPSSALPSQQAQESPVQIRAGWSIGHWYYFSALNENVNNEKWLISHALYYVKFINK